MGRVNRGSFRTLARLSFYGASTSWQVNHYIASYWFSSNFEGPIKYVAHTESINRESQQKHTFLREFTYDFKKVSLAGFCIMY